MFNQGVEIITMARKITQDAVAAFIAGMDFCRSNTRVECYVNGEIVMYLHNNAIAKSDTDGKLYVSCGGWTSHTTKERLNGLLSKLDLGGIYQKDWVWYFDDGTPFDTEGWNLIKL